MAFGLFPFFQGSLGGLPFLSPILYNTDPLRAWEPTNCIHCMPCCVLGEPRLSDDCHFDFHVLASSFSEGGCQGQTYFLLTINICTLLYLWM